MNFFVGHLLLNMLCIGVVRLVSYLTNFLVFLAITESLPLISYGVSVTLDIHNNVDFYNSLFF